MFNYFLNKPVLVLLILIILIIISIPFQEKIDNQRSKFSSIEKTVYFKPSTLKKFSLGFDELLADLYWFRALQYFGDPDTKMVEKDPQLVYKYFDTLTELDPKFVNAYRFGGSFLSEPIPIGMGEYDKGIKLLDKGRKNNPDNFRLPFEEAFLYYLYTDDYSRASELFKEASEKEGLSDTRRASIKGMAASSGAKAGDRELSKLIWEDIYNNTKNEGRKKFAFNNLKKLQTMDFEDKLTEIALQFKDDKGYYPGQIIELLNYNYIKKIPKDYGDTDFFITKNLSGIKSVTLSKDILDENIRFLKVRVRRFNSDFERNPENITELKEYILNNSYSNFPDHPLGEEYIYDSETGVVDYDKWFLQ